PADPDRQPDPAGRGQDVHRRLFRRRRVDRGPDGPLSSLEDGSEVYFGYAEEDIELSIETEAFSKIGWNRFRSRPPSLGKGKPVRPPGGHPKVHDDFGADREEDRKPEASCFGLDRDHLGIDRVVGGVMGKSGEKAGGPLGKIPKRFSELFFEKTLFGPDDPGQINHPHRADHQEEREAFKKEGGGEGETETSEIERIPRHGVRPPS